MWPLRPLSSPLQTKSKNTIIGGRDQQIQMALRIRFRLDCFLKRPPRMKQLHCIVLYVMHSHNPNRPGVRGGEGSGSVRELRVTVTVSRRRPHETAVCTALHSTHGADECPGPAPPPAPAAFSGTRRTICAKWIRFPRYACARLKRENGNVRAKRHDCGASALFATE